MVKKKYIKSTWRLFFHHLVRLLSISAIFLVSLSLGAGLYNSTISVKEVISETYKQGNVYDFSLIGAKDKIDSMEATVKNDPDKYRISDIEKVAFYEISSDTQGFSKRITFMDFNNHKINKLKLIENGGNFPGNTLIDNRIPIVVNTGTEETKEHKIGDKLSYTIKLDQSPVPSVTFDLVVVGIVRNPAMLGEFRETCMMSETNYIDDAFYINQDIISKLSFLQQSVINNLPRNLLLTFNQSYRQIFNSYSKDYQTRSNETKDLLKKDADKITGVTVLTLFENYTLYFFSNSSEKVNVLSIIFIIFFILITILVVYSTMSRLLDEERGNIAVYKTLGYSDFLIRLRYILFAFVGGLIGILLAYFPSYLIVNMVLDAYSIQFMLNMQVASNSFPIFLIISAIVLAISLILVTISSHRNIGHKPVELLTPKIPKIGGKILLECINFIWKRLSFKYKSTCRNVFRFKSRFFMTVLSILAATVLVFAALALFNNSMKIEKLDSLKTVSYVILVFSAVLCAIVVYNITNINISERTREIATLMVLGYQNKEVTGYIYREIYVMTVIAALIGLPAGIGFTQFLFTYCKFGELANVEWWSYVLTPIITCIFAVLSTRLLHRKIVKIDMNDSLKVIE